MAVDTIPDEGLHRAIAAPAEICTGVAALAGAREVSLLSAEFDLIREGALVLVTGRVRARVGQTCVVSLEPIETEVDEPIDVTFAPAVDSDAGAHKADEEPPEPLIGGTVDLGAIATEFLILGLDPYPRKAGVEFSPPAVEKDGPHPFAALAALKKGSGGGRP